MPDNNQLEELLAKITKLKESGVFDETAIAQFDAWEQQVLSSAAQSSIIDSDIIKTLVVGAQAQVAMIETQLYLKSDKLPDRQRDVLVDIRTVWLYLIGVFTGNVSALSQITQLVAENMADLPPSK